MKYLSLGVVILLNSCAILRPVKYQPSPCHLEFESDAKKYWHFDTKGKYYVADTDFIFKLTDYYSKCIKGCDTSYIFKILGRQNVYINPLKWEPKIPYSAAIIYNSDQSDKTGWLNIVINCDTLGKVQLIGSFSILKPQGAHGY